MKTHKITVQQAEDNSRVLHLEVHSNFKEKVASKFYAVQLLTLLSGTTGKMQYYLKLSIKSWSSCWNSAKLGYKTLVWDVKKAMSGLGKENEKVLFIVKKKKISIIIGYFNLLTKVINPYISGCSKPLQLFELDQTFPTISQLLLSVFLWEFMTLGIHYTVQQQIHSTVIHSFPGSVHHRFLSSLAHQCSDLV